MPDKSTSGDAGRELPQTKGLVPRSREGVCTVGRNHAIGDDVRVSMETSLWVTVGGFVAGKIPYDQGLVARG